MPVERTPARNGGAPVLNDKEEIKLTEPRTRLYSATNLEGEGFLHLTNQRLVWLSTSNSSVGYAIDYPFIAVHAVSRDAAAWPEPCLYCQLRTEECDDEEEEPDIPELRFVPAEPAHLQNMFVAFSECSALNPDPNDTQDGPESSSEEEDEEEDGLLFGIGEAPKEMGVFWNADDDDEAMEDAEEDEEEVEGPEGDDRMAMET
mmetsp:Transcript_161117/g.283955  ORF Transcript_161117/g.283955 Transcript_161117/m.283955 type:complete len:203 (+) Transcript_161117:116-724(+)